MKQIIPSLCQIVIQNYSPKMKLLKQQKFFSCSKQLQIRQDCTQIHHLYKEKQMGPYFWPYFLVYQNYSVIMNPHANAGDIRDAGSIPGLGRAPGERHGNPLQYSCLDHPRDRGAWWATVHGVAKSQTQLKQLSMHACNWV